MASSSIVGLTATNLNFFHEDTRILALSEAGSASEAEEDAHDIIDDDNYEGIDWSRLPESQKPFKSLRRINSFIWQHGYRIQERIASKTGEKKVYWECKYCHDHRISKGRFESTQSTSGAVRHLAIDKPGHCLSEAGPIEFSHQRHRKSVLELIQAKHEVSQEAANKIISIYSAAGFKQAVLDWITLNNHPLSEVETPSFRKMIAAANLDAEADLWLSHSHIRWTIL